ncbi:MAG: hypothetical protein JO002_02670 [Burkholderiaceae bacterium]|nr:hypothetical protein [Burkholderiaceae bacterium]
MADNSSQGQGPASPGPGKQAFHPELYKFTAQHLEERPFGANPREGTASGLQQAKPSSQFDAKSGVQWTTNDSHPGLNYQVDKNEELRVRLGGHGAKATFAIKF